MDDERIELAEMIFRSRDLQDKRIIIIQQVMQMNKLDKSTEEYKINERILSAYNRVMNE